MICSTDITSDTTARLEGRAVAFELDGARYLIPLDRVREVQRIVALTPVPTASAAILGVLNLRGEAVPAIDVRTALGRRARRPELDTPMVIVESASHEIAALVVDAVDDVVTLDGLPVARPSALGAQGGPIGGVVDVDDDQLFVLDVDALIASVAAAGANHE